MNFYNPDADWAKIARSDAPIQIELNQVTFYVRANYHGNDCHVYSEKPVSKARYAKQRGKAMMDAYYEIFGITEMENNFCCDDEGVMSIIVMGSPLQKELKLKDCPEI